MRSFGSVSTLLSASALLSAAACGGDDQGTPSLSSVFTASAGFASCDAYCRSISASCVQGGQVAADHPCSSRIEWGSQFDSMLCSALVYDRSDGTEDKSDGKGATCSSVCSMGLWTTPDRKSARCCCAD
jgi:hypothetical protein